MLICLIVKDLKPIQNHTEMVDMLKEAGNSILLKKLVLPKEKIQDVEEEEGCVVEYQGDKIGVYKEKGGKIFAVKPICTHLGCELVFNSTLKTWIALAMVQDLIIKEDQFQLLVSTT